MEHVAHAMENVFTAMRQKTMDPTVEDFDLLQRTLNVLSTILAGEDVPEEALVSVVSGLGACVGGEAANGNSMAKASEPDGGPDDAPGETDPRPGTERQEEPLAGEGRAPCSLASGAGKPRPADSDAGMQAKPCAVPPKPVDTMRVAVSKLDSFLLKAEAMLSAKLILEQRIADTRNIKTSFGRVEEGVVQARGHSNGQPPERRPRGPGVVQAVHGQDAGVPGGRGKGPGRLGVHPSRRFPFRGRPGG